MKKTTITTFLGGWGEKNGRGCLFAAPDFYWDVTF